MVKLICKDLQKFRKVASFCICKHQYGGALKLLGYEGDGTEVAMRVVEATQMKALEAMKAIIDFGSGELHLPGKGDTSVVLPPGSTTFVMSHAPSGHLVLPCDDYRTKPPSKDIDQPTIALPVVPPPGLTPKREREAEIDGAWNEWRRVGRPAASLPSSPAPASSQ